MSSRSYYRPLQTVMPWDYFGRPRLLAVTWAAAADAPHGARVCAVHPMPGQHHIPIGLPAICVAVTVGLYAGLDLEQIVAATSAIETRYGDCSYGFRPMDTIGALAARLIAYELESAPAASFAYETEPAPIRLRSGSDDDNGGPEATA